MTAQVERNLLVRSFQIDQNKECPGQENRNSAPLVGLVEGLCDCQ